MSDSLSSSIVAGVPGEVRAVLFPKCFERLRWLGVLVVEVSKKIPDHAERLGFLSQVEALLSTSVRGPKVWELVNCDRLKRIQERLEGFERRQGSRTTELGATIGVAFRDAHDALQHVVAIDPVDRDGIDQARASSCHVFGAAAVAAITKAQAISGRIALATRAAAGAISNAVEFGEHYPSRSHAFAVEFAAHAAGVDTASTSVAVDQAAIAASILEEVRAEACSILAALEVAAA